MTISGIRSLEGVRSRASIVLFGRPSRHLIGITHVLSTHVLSTHVLSLRAQLS